MDLVRKNADGKTVSLCLICDTQKGVSDGLRVPFKASIIFWSIFRNSVQQYLLKDTWFTPFTVCFYSGDTASCLHNAPHEDDALGRALPGTLLSLDAQCRRDRGTSACFKDERVCAQLFCFDAASGYCVAYRPAAEGSPCGDGSVNKNVVRFIKVVIFNNFFTVSFF